MFSTTSLKLRPFERGRIAGRADTEEGAEKKMKKFVSVALLVALTSGCGLFAPKPEENQNQGGGDQAQAQGGGVDPTTFVQAPGRVPV